MPKITELISKEKPQFLAIAAMSAGAVGLAGIINFSSAHVFQRFIGNINPLAASLLVSLLGFIFLTFLLSQGWFTIYKKENLQGLVRSAGIAALFGVIMVLVDLKVIFPADLNILFPESLLFYPAIGFFAEVLFHVLPLSALLIILTSVLKNVSYKHIVWTCIFVVALLEPAYQTRMGFSKPYPFWVMIYVGLHVFLINLSELFIFKRYDFVSMYAFRLVYYMFWHVGWGYARLMFITEFHLEPKFFI